MLRQSHSKLLGVKKWDKDITYNNVNLTKVAPSLISATNAWKKIATLGATIDSEPDNKSKSDDDDPLNAVNEWDDGISLSMYD